MDNGVRRRRVQSWVTFVAVAVLQYLIVGGVITSGFYSADEVNWLTLALNLLAANMAIVVLQRSFTYLDSWHRRDITGAPLDLALIPEKLSSEKEKSYWAWAGVAYSLCFLALLLIAGGITEARNWHIGWGGIVALSMTVSAMVGLFVFSTKAGVFPGKRD